MANDTAAVGPVGARGGAMPLTTTGPAVSDPPASPPDAMSSSSPWTASAAPRPTATHQLHH